MKYYIAYGSNSPQEMVSRCPGSEYLGTAVLPDWTLVFSTFATIIPKKGSMIQVHLYKITEANERELDYYEGYPRLYNKKTVQVCFEGARIKSTVYCMDKHFLMDYSFPNKSYLDRIIDGYDYAGIPRKQLVEAVNTTIQKYLERIPGKNE